MSYFTTIDAMTDTELRGVINSSHKAKEYDAYFEACCKELNTRYDGDFRAQETIEYLIQQGAIHRCL